MATLSWDLGTAETKGVSPTSLGHQVGWTGGTGAWLGLSLSMWTLIVQWFSSSSATGWLDPKKAKVETTRHLEA